MFCSNINPILPFHNSKFNLAKFLITVACDLNLNHLIVTHAIFHWPKLISAVITMHMHVASISHYSFRGPLSYSFIR